MGTGMDQADKNKWIAARRHSCAFVNTPSPCVNKAIHHIQELELKVEKFFQKYGYVFKEKIPRITEQVSAESIKDTSLSLSTKLDFKEADISCEDGKTLTLKQETEALLLEVTELIKRLEADREEAEKALELEKQRGKKLRMKIDRMSLWRLQHIPAAVQKEYDMCIQDTLELQWHLDCKRHQRQQLQNQIFKTETANREIQEDIDFMKKHSPLLEEKLILEGEAVNEVLMAYEKASKIYSDVCCELMEIEKTMKRIDEESEKKIKSMYEKMKCAEMLLSKCNEFLDLVFLEFRIILTRYLEIEDLKNKIAAQGDENVKISAASSEVFKAVEELKSIRKSDLQNRKQTILNINEALDILKSENEELERENEKILQKIGNSSRKKKEYESEVETICENICKLDEQIKRQKEDISNAELSYNKIKRKYDDLKKNKTAEEISYKARIKAIHDELQEKRKEKLKKRKEDTKRIEEIERQVPDLETKFKRNKDLFKEKHEEKISFVSSQIAENSHTVENLKNEIKELNGLWNMKQIEMENAEKSLVELRYYLASFSEYHHLDYYCLPLMQQKD
ncbi:hypothetical protein llap_7441 [Limosa lapponica baueri]|uniref:Coiled-coil domain-containing protein 178 n=1 Tax=Limosa lapponica baueri TaxID=1758121 RepID=A0A2I0U8E8_LIMLA|nr:hypothetical protein llap_7441 [Limosa lapponica baueri]